MTGGSAITYPICHERYEAHVVRMKLEKTLRRRFR
jgi:hypothetical protein